MKYYMFEVQQQKQNDRVLAYANNEDEALDILIDEFGNDCSFFCLGWCIKQIADDLGYEVYEKPIKGLTIKELYAWAQANGREDMQFVYGNGNGDYWPCTRHPAEYVVSDTEICVFED